jgi:two-component sensor histidine kinase
MSQFLYETRFEAFAQTANGLPPAEILAGICKAFEGHVAGSVAGVTILDRTAQLFEHAIFPSLSPDYGSALRGIAVADKPGSCALAVFNGKAVVCEDVASDDRFSQGWKDLGAAHGLHALVSIPAFHKEGVVLGTFVVGWPLGKGLTDEQMQLAEEFARLCALVLTYRRNQLRQELLIGELQHRMRNLFSTIGAVVYATLKSHPEASTFRKVFDGRLLALSRAHSIALQAEEADLRQLLVETLAPYSIDHDVKLEGPRLQLTQEAAVAFSLATHELATNAAKYGAFSNDGGSVRIGWDLVDDGAGKPTFQLTWQESGGPKVSKPVRHGFGQETVRRSLASAIDGKVELDFDPAGLQCRVVAPHSTRLGALVN